MKFFVTIVSMLFFQSLAAKDLNKEITFKVYDQLIAQYSRLDVKVAMEKIKIRVMHTQVSYC